MPNANFGSLPVLSLKLFGSLKSKSPRITYRFGAGVNIDVAVLSYLSAVPIIVPFYRSGYDRL